MKIISIQVGLPKTVSFRGRPVITGIFKNPVVGPLMIRTLNIDGDAQADLTVHGGKDKAIYAYSFDAYPWWKNERPIDTFEYGAFGENLLVDQMNEEEAYVGDTYEIGDAILQVAQPRLPCYKLGVKFNDPTILRTFMKSRRPGVYFRVLKEGLINIGQEFKWIDGEKVKLSISQLFRIAHGEIVDTEIMSQYLKIKSLPDVWRCQLTSLLET